MNNYELLKDQVLTAIIKEKRVYRLSKIAYSLLFITGSLLLIKLYGQ